MSVGSAEWEQLEHGFREAFSVEISDAPRRTQDRLIERFDAPRAEMAVEYFENESDTDWSLPQNGAWAERIVARNPTRITEIPLIIPGEEIRLSSPAGVCRDPSRLGAVVARYHIANADHIERAVACAKADPDGWRTMTVVAQSEVLGRVAQELRRARADLMWVPLANGVKTLAESDPEVSEVVDFLEFYRASARAFFETPNLSASPRGVVIVVPPWNFPIAIPCGGIAAALAAGNTVILKPASDAVFIAWELCQCFWRAGVSRRVLQFAPCPGSGACALLVSHPDVGAAILTGGNDTAWLLLKARPDLHLSAETGGKNAIIITALSDRELAIKHVVQSAFGHSGQKCSATSLLLLEAEVYDDPSFKRMLCDAVKSLHVGSAWNLHTRLGPLIYPPSGDLEHPLKTLEPFESWAVRPQQVGDNTHLWSPGVKWGVQPGSVTHLTEFFGPVLGVMRFERLAEAIELVNQTGYGLTSGLHSLDEREHEQWKSGIRAGNLYINRGTTGDIVLRKPFGGMGKSCFGSSMKAGGPNYLAQFMKFAERSEPAIVDTHTDLLLPDLVEKLRDLAPTAAPASEVRRAIRAIASYSRNFRDEFGRQHDHFRLLGQDNLRRYLPVGELRIRIGAKDTFFENLARIAAACITGCRITVSHATHIVQLRELTMDGAGEMEFVEENDSQLAAVIRARRTDRVRFASPDRVPQIVRVATAESGLFLAEAPVLAEGRIELLWYLREQSLSHDYHRYGNLGARGGELRKIPQ